MPRYHAASVCGIHSLDGFMVNALAAAGKIYVAGEFTRVGSARREHLAAFDAATGSLNAWNPGVSGLSCRAMT